MSNLIGPDKTSDKSLIKLMPIYLLSSENLPTIGREGFGHSLVSKLYIVSCFRSPGERLVLSAMSEHVQKQISALKGLSARTRSRPIVGKYSLDSRIIGII